MSIHLLYVSLINRNHYKKTEIMEKKFLGCIERTTEPYDKTLVFAFWNDQAKPHEMGSGYLIEFYDREGLVVTCELFDNDHVYRELKARGFKKSYIKVILSML